MKKLTFRGARRVSIPRELSSRPLALGNRISKKTVETCKQRRREVSKQSNHHLCIQCTTQINSVGRINGRMFSKQCLHNL